MRGINASSADSGGGGEITSFYLYVRVDRTTRDTHNTRILPILKYASILNACWYYTYIKKKRWTWFDVVDLLDTRRYAAVFSSLSASSWPHLTHHSAASYTRYTCIMSGYSRSKISTASTLNSSTISKNTCARYKITYVSHFCIPTGGMETGYAELG